MFRFGFGHDPTGESVGAILPSPSKQVIATKTLEFGGEITFRFAQQTPLSVRFDQ